MATVDSTNTLAEIEAAVADNVSYEEDDSRTKALAFITAALLYMLKKPASMSAGGSVTYGVFGDLPAQVKHARQFADAKRDNSAGSVRHLSQVNARD